MQHIHLYTHACSTYTYTQTHAAHTHIHTRMQHIHIYTHACSTHTHTHTHTCSTYTYTHTHAAHTHIHRRMPEIQASLPKWPNSLVVYTLSTANYTSAHRTHYLGHILGEQCYGCSSSVSLCHWYCITCLPPFPPLTAPVSRRYIKGKVYIGHAQSDISVFHPDECKFSKLYFFSGKDHKLVASYKQLKEFMVCVCATFKLRHQFSKNRYLAPLFSKSQLAVIEESLSIAIKSWMLTLCLQPHTSNYYRYSHLD